MLYELCIPVYDVGLLFFLVFYLQKYLLRKRITSRLFQRIIPGGRLKSLLAKADKPIWIHAVSVGEINSIREFFKRIRAIYPDVPVAISVVTPEAKALASTLYGNEAVVFYLPLDISVIVKKFIALINPRLFLVMETEIWPNLYFFLHKKNVPIIIFNSRISNKSIRFYKLVRLFLKFILTRVSFIAAQDNKAKERFLHLGANADSIRVTGNMKFKSIEIPHRRVAEFKNKWESKIKNGNLLIVAGSTHHPEEEIFLDTFKDLLCNFKNINLLICPRHVQRVPGVVKLSQKYGFNPVRITKFDFQIKGEDKRKNVFILDTTGELIYFYSLADIVFVGGSLARYGGHNIIEPAYFAKPVVFGHLMFNFEDIRRIFIQRRASLEVKNKEHLKEVLDNLILDADLREELGRKGRLLLDESKDSVEENIKIVENFIQP